MKMKMKIKILLIIFFLFNFSILYSQTFSSLNEQSASEKPENDNYAAPGASMQPFSMEYDFNNDGTKEVFKGIMLKEINKNTFWVKNAKIVNTDNEIVVDIGKKIIVNGEPLTNQISSVNGYIIEILKNKLLVSIANEKGEKNSDELLINIKETK